jgi:hypothetical protein
MPQRFDEKSEIWREIEGFLTVEAGWREALRSDRRARSLFDGKAVKRESTEAV